MHAFLKRHYKKSGKGAAKPKKEETGSVDSVDSGSDSPGGPMGVLKYDEAVSKSMDSLLMVVSSVPLPPDAKLSLPPTSTTPAARRQDSLSSHRDHHSDNELPAMGRRHSFDTAAAKLTDDEDDDYDDDEDDDDTSLAGVSRSEEASPARGTRGSASSGGGGGGGGTRRVGRMDSSGSRDETDRALQKGFLQSFGTSASFTSEREMTESDEVGGDGDDDDDARSFVSVRTNDSCVFMPDVGVGVGVGVEGGGDDTAEQHEQQQQQQQQEEEEEGDEEEGEEGSGAGGGGRESDSPLVLSAEDAMQAEAELMQQETALRQRQTVLMEHPFFLLDVKLQEGVDLVIRDSCGTSDPYVKFKIGGKQVYRSKTIFKNLNPKWDESFTLAIEDITKPLYLKVFDYDRGFHDDPMGNALIDISQFELGKTTELKLELSERGKTEYMGYLILTCTLQPKTQDDKDQFLRRTVRVSGESAATRKLKLQMWAGVVTIVLVDGRDLMAMDDNGFSDPYVKFRLGAEKYRSKVKYKTLSPRWLEQFDLRLFNEQSTQLEISVFDYDAGAKDDFMGRATIDVSGLETEVTHRLDLSLVDGAGRLTLLLTISGLWGAEAVSDLANHTPDSRQQAKLTKQYKPLKLSKISDVGHLQVKVFKATNLKAADLGGYSDPFCVLEVVNDRRQTHTEYKTLNPEWNKIFEFPVLDIHSVLEVTVFDENRDKKVEFLGKVSIPLLRIKSGEKKWYTLKDKKLIHRSKGAILLEMNVVFNHVKAAIRTVNPAEKKLMQVEPKFKIQVMKRNIDRVSQLVAIFVDGGKFLQSCFSWESTTRSLSAFIIFLVMVWSFELYMLPITLLIIFLKNLVIAQILGALKREHVEADEHFEDDDDDDDEDKEKNTKAKEEKKSFKEKLLSIQDVCLQVQQGMDMVASLGERVKNTSNWTVPWLTTLAVVALTVGVIVLYHVPLRWLILAWGINKFTKKLRKPNAISNNELLDFLSRVPSDSEIVQYRELRPESSPPPKKKRS